jgi:hypothetical protein
MTVSEHSSSRRMNRQRFYIVTCFVALIVYAALSFADLAMDASLLPFTIAAAAVMMFFGFAWLRALDEMATQAHYVGWYWGGSMGLAFALLVVVALTPDLFAQRPLPFTPFDGEGGAFLSGYLWGIVPPSVGYMSWWAVYWLRRR